MVNIQMSKESAAQSQHSMSLETISKGVAVHFAAYLQKKNILKNGHISKVDLCRVFVQDYQADHPNYFTAGNIVRTLQQYGFVVVGSDGILTLVDLPVVQNGILPSLPKESYLPRKKVYVNQSLVFRAEAKAEQGQGVTNDGCQLCKTTFTTTSQYEMHIREPIHLIKEMYRTNRSQLLEGFGARAFVGGDNSLMAMRPNEIRNLSIRMTHKNDKPLTVTEVYEVYPLKECVRLVKNLPVVVKSKTPMGRPSGTEICTLRIQFTAPGAYMYPLVFRVEHSGNVKYLLINEEPVFRVQSELMDELGPVEPYFRPAYKFLRVTEQPVVQGEPLEKASSELKYVLPLEESPIPSSLIRLLNHTFKPYDGMSDVDRNQHQSVLKLLSSENFTIATYSDKFGLLLHIEEQQMKKDIRNYDRYNQVLLPVKENKRLLALQVPGLAEKRPSVLRRDSIIVHLRSSNGEVRNSACYEGIVHNIKEETVELGFNAKFLKLYMPGMRVDVEFTFNRHQLKLEHRALKMLKKQPADNIIFPATVQPAPVTVSHRLMNNTKIKNNPEQAQAVRNIVTRTSCPAPYIVFGPPGTGKTVTLVEAAIQIWQTSDTSHLLLCAPSNSAADILAKRVLAVLPASNVLRIYAAQWDYNNVDNSIKEKKCHNFSNETIYYPSLEKVLKYRVVVTTLCTAGRLVGANVPTGHFSHVMIDECGYATEPESLICIAGLLTNNGKSLEKLKAGQLVIAGDPMQLGPILRSPIAVKHGLSMSLLERLMTQMPLYKKSDGVPKYNEKVITKLVFNYRSHKDIIHIPNDMFYDNELQVKGELQEVACNWHGLVKKGFPLIFHGVIGKDERESTSPSYFNRTEIDQVLVYLGSLIGETLSGYKVRQHDIGVITPYRKQVQKLKQVLKKKNWNDIKVGSVEDFQGDERLIIIVSTVRSTQQLLQDDYKFNLGFLRNPKRFNVAVTRAKALLIVVGNPNILQCDPHWYSMLKFIKNNGGYKGVPCALSSAAPCEIQMDNLNLDLQALSLLAAEENPEPAKWKGEM